MTYRYLLALLLCFATPHAWAAEEVSTELDGFLRQGQIREALAHFAEPSDNAERFSLAVAQAASGLQQFSIGMNGFTMRDEMNSSLSRLPFFRTVLAGAGAGSSRPATPERIGALFHDLREALRSANETLTAMDDAAFKVEINLSQWRMDFDGDGVIAPEEMLILSLKRSLSLPTTADEMVVRFDSADAIWLKGYTHVLLGMLDLMMAYDWRPVWDQVAHQIFEECDPMPSIATVTERQGSMDFHAGADLVAALHALRLELVDDTGPARARQHLQSTVACSRLMWQRILAESDDDLEWVPSPKQTGPGGATISQTEINAWTNVLDELEAILDGRKLMPHWRLRSGLGINLHKLTTAPPPLDLIMFVQGSAFVPFVEEGEVSNSMEWRNLTEPFGGRFGTFAAWVN